MPKEKSPPLKGQANPRPRSPEFRPVHQFRLHQDRGRQNRRWQVPSLHPVPTGPDPTRQVDRPSPARSFSTSPRMRLRQNHPANFHSTPALPLAKFPQHSPVAPGIERPTLHLPLAPANPPPPAHPIPPRHRKPPLAPIDRHHPHTPLSSLTSSLHHLRIIIPLVGPPVHT